MSIHLVGGPMPADTEPAIYGAFIAEAAERAVHGERLIPRIAVVIVHDGNGTDDAAAWRRTLERSGACEPVVALVREGATLDQTALVDIDGLIVAGGLTPAYAVALEPVTGEIRRQVADGLPYLGYSAGAALAADRALIGGWQIGGVPVCPEDASEELDDVTIQQGIGLIDVTVDVHAAQWGTVARAIAATEAGLVEGVLAIDEATALVVGEGPLRVVGPGSVWQISGSENGVRVVTLAEG
ncbi:peptidase S51 [Leifsonia sp. ALI-44-B]|jgi:cyanophycinase|uniref:peptidase S51 n=1 Tax=Leifsonia sp. ALI-44-B TaxID=1933776 RepID=UPI00097BF5D8|nr:peptidase S51 [Leifsonia sp. ALI-44-B]ONI61670.1 peptidase S51 [Leifsonia sp. ALI-44-B]